MLDLTQYSVVDCSLVVASSHSCDTQISRQSPPQKNPKVSETSVRLLRGQLIFFFFFFFLVSAHQTAEHT